VCWISLRKGKIGSSLQDGKSWEKNRLRTENPPAHRQKPAVNQIVMNPPPYSTEQGANLPRQGAEAAWQGGSRDSEPRHCAPAGFAISHHYYCHNHIQFLDKMR
jgi:hypothetical protein